jgi:hypothetical protein
MKMRMTHQVFFKEIVYSEQRLFDSLDIAEVTHDLVARLQEKKYAPVGK